MFLDLGSNPADGTSLRNFGNPVYPALPVSFGRDIKSRRSLLSGVYAREVKDSTQTCGKCGRAYPVVDSSTLREGQSSIKKYPCIYLRLSTHSIGRREEGIFLIIMM